MKVLDFRTMTKKDEFIHIRSDEELKQALEKDAAKNDRKMTDHARFLLRLALGLSQEGRRPAAGDTLERLLTPVEELEREVLRERTARKKGAG